MTREEAKEILEEIKAIDDSIYQYNADYLEALDMAINALEQEPCEDAISRAEAIKTMNDLEQEDIERYGCHIPEGFDGERAVEALQSLPSVTPQPKTGHWIYDRTRDWDGECKYECSECGMGSDVGYPYCMRCGAKMIETQESEG